MTPDADPPGGAPARFCTKTATAEATTPHRRRCAAPRAGVLSFSALGLERYAPHQLPGDTVHALLVAGILRGCRLR